MHAALCRAGDGLFDIAVLHLLGFYEQGVMGAVDEGGEILARVHGADNQVGIVKLRCRAVPVSVEDVDSQMICLSDESSSPEMPYCFITSLSSNDSIMLSGPRGNSTNREIPNRYARVIIPRQERRGSSFCNSSLGMVG